MPNLRRSVTVTATPGASVRNNQETVAQNNLSPLVDTELGLTPGTTQASSNLESIVYTWHRRADGSLRQFTVTAEYSVKGAWTADVSQ